MCRGIVMAACVVGFWSGAVFGANYVPISASLDAKVGALRDYKPTGALSGPDQATVSDTYFSGYSGQTYTATATAQTILTGTAITIDVKTTGSAGLWLDVAAENPSATATVMFRLGEGAQLGFSEAYSFPFEGLQSMSLTGPDGALRLTIGNPVPVSAGDYTFTCTALTGWDHGLARYGSYHVTLDVLAVPEPSAMAPVLAAAMAALLRRVRGRPLTSSDSPHTAHTPAPVSRSSRAARHR